MMPEPILVQTVGERLSALISGWVSSAFGTFGAGSVYGPITRADILAALILLGLTLIVSVIVTGWMGLVRRRHERKQTTESWPYQMLQACSRPVYAAVWLFGFYIALVPLVLKAQSGESASLRLFATRLANVLVFAILVWLFYRLTAVLRVRLEIRARKSESKVDDLLIPPAMRTIRVIVPLFAVILGLPLLGLPAAYDEVVKKASSLLLIGVIAWIMFQAVRLAEGFLLSKYDVKAADNLEARKVYTQVKVLSKTVYVVISILAAASMLMVFEEARRFGTNILASAGVVGLIVGFAAQRTIANLFAGFQLAMTQPIRLDDVVVVEGEWGRVEEITLTYVVINIWDQRRLILPLSYFIEKPFQNWTRISSEIMGTIFVWADYTMPIEAIRKEARRLVESHPDWDKRFWNVQVTDATDRAIQIRVLVTAADSGKAWNMRCDIRERLIDFIQKQHSANLPQLRGEIRAEFPRQESEARV